MLQEDLQKSSSSQDAPFILHCSTSNASVQGSTVLVPTHVFVPESHRGFLCALWEMGKLEAWPRELGQQRRCLDVQLRVRADRL